MISTAIDLSKLAPPSLIEALSFEAMLAELKLDVAARCAAAGIPFDAPALESEPLVIALEAAAYRELLLRSRVNDAARGVMVAFAVGADLDHLGALFGVARLVITPAAVVNGVPVPAVMEDDTAFRARIVLAPEGYSVAGPEGAYVFHGLSADGDVLGIAAQSPTPGQVVVTVLSRTGNGAASAPLLAKVAAHLSGETVRPLTDQVTVQSAAIVNYAITASLKTFAGPDSATVMAAAHASAQKFAAESHRLGRDVTLSGVYAALHVPGVQRVTLTAPAADVAIAPHQAPHCTAVTLNWTGVDE